MVLLIHKHLLQKPVPIYSAKAVVLLVHMYLLHKSLPIYSSKAVALLIHMCFLHKISVDSYVFASQKFTHR